MRFLALAILEMDPETPGLLCFEEPENGIHPQRIAAMLRLLKDLCVDTEDPIGPDNPLRQVIINTHSPTVVGAVEDEDLLVAEARQMADSSGGAGGGVFLAFRHLAAEVVAGNGDRGARRAGTIFESLAFAEDEEDSESKRSLGKRFGRRESKTGKTCKFSCRLPATHELSAFDSRNRWAV